MWTNLTIRPTVTLLVDGPRNWQKKIQFLGLTILNSFIILTSHCSKLSQQQFRQRVGRDLIKDVGRGYQTHTTRQGRQAPSISQLQIKMHGARHNKQWPTQYMRIGVMCALLKAKTREWISSIQNARTGCALANVTSCTKPNCISMDQLTWNWQSRALKYKLNITVLSTEPVFSNSISLM